MKAYKILERQTCEQGQYAIVPIRFEDRFKIMQWRNEQMFHLRQNKPLSKADQEHYFENVVAKLFDQKQPLQILFSFLADNECVGYGGLVHINWPDRNAEISFLMNTDLEQENFETYWSTYLSLIKKVAFEQLQLHKIYTYSYYVRPRLYPVLKSSGFRKDAILKEHAFIEGRPVDVHIDCIMNIRLDFRVATINDLEITYEWARNPDVRAFSIQNHQISSEEHEQWFRQKINDERCVYFVVTYFEEPIGSFRLDLLGDGAARISYLLDPKHHGKGLGRKVLEQGIEEVKGMEDVRLLIGQVFIANEPSKHLFESLGFEITNEEEGLLTFKKAIK